MMVCSLTCALYNALLADVGNYYYGQGHPMKPHRIRMTHNLLVNYGLYKKMQVFVSFLLFFAHRYCFDHGQRPRRASDGDMTKFHSDDYIQFLKMITPDNMNEYSKQLQRYIIDVFCALASCTNILLTMLT